MPRSGTSYLSMAAEEEKEVLAEMPPFFYYYSDGSVLRCPPLPLVRPSVESPDVSLEELMKSEGDGKAVASKDITLDQELGLWARIFVPLRPHGRRLPLILYFHGGGFVFGGPDWRNFHAFCTDMATRSPSIWVSVSYRLAPEHRLPAAYDDGYAALKWLHTQALLQNGASSPDVEGTVDPWLAAVADFSECFITGESAGGNLSYHVVMRAIAEQPPSSWHPLCIKGLILIHPGFMRSNRSQEELDAPQDMLANWKSVESCLKCTLPADFPSGDEAYWNPLPELHSKKNSLETFPRTLVALADCDMLYIMDLESVKALKTCGCRVETEISHGVGHVFHVTQPESEQAQFLMQRISSFIAEEG